MKIRVKGLGAGRPRRGFAMLLLAVAAASICTVTVSTQSSGTIYETQSIRQLMRNEQAHWLSEAYNELGLAAQCDTGSTIFPITNASTPRALGFTVGDSADAYSQEMVLVTTPKKFGNQSGSPFDHDIEVKVYADLAMKGTPLVEREINARAILLQPAASGRQCVQTNGVTQHSGWGNRDADVVR